MRTELERVADLLQQGKVTPEQAAQLLRALAENATAADTTPAPAPSAIESESTPKAAAGRAGAANDTDSGAPPASAAPNSDFRRRPDAEARDTVAEATADARDEQSRGAEDGEADDNRADDDGAEPHWRHRRGRRHWQRRQHRRYDKAWETLGEELASTVGAALKMSLSALTGDRRDGAGGASWMPPSNRVTLSRALPPSGERFKFEDNDITVSDLARLEFHVAEFSANQLRASSVSDLTLVEGIVRGQHLNGSSLRGTRVEHGLLNDNHWNGGSATRLTIRRGQLSDSKCNASSLRDVVIDGSIVEQLACAGSGLRNVRVLEQSLLRRFSVQASNLENVDVRRSQLLHVRLRAQHVSGWTMDNCTLENVKFGVRDWPDLRGRGDSARIRQLTFSDVQLKDVRFVDCRFDRTTFAGFTLTDAVFEGADLRGQRITSADELLRFATSSAGAAAHG